MCNEMEIRIIVNNMWTPTPAFTNDCNLIEVAVKDPYFTPRRKWKIEVINNCRQYIGVFFISKLMDEYGKVKQGFLNGDIRVTQNLKLFPYARKPPQYAWGTGKPLFFTTFSLMAIKYIHPLATLYKLPTTMNMRQK